MIESIIIHALAVYAVTLVIASSYAMKGARRLFRQVMASAVPWFVARNFVIWDADASQPGNPVIVTCDREEMDLSEERHYHGFSFIECRLCLGLWITLLLCSISTAPFHEWLPIYGASYFLTTQER